MALHQWSGTMHWDYVACGIQADREYGTIESNTTLTLGF